MAKTSSRKAAPARKTVSLKKKKASSKGKRLFTIGYQETPPKAVLDELESAGVKLLVDVRAVASSRRPGFSKNQLASGLKERGIGYLHFQGLGTPKEGRLAARAGDIKALEQIYARHLKTPQARQEMDELATLIGNGRPGLHPLLRTRPQGLPSQIHCGHHRGARRRCDREFSRAAGLARCHSGTRR